MPSAELTQATEVDAACFGKRGHASLVLFAERARLIAEPFATHAEHLDDGAHVRDDQPDEPACAEADPEGDVAEHSEVLVAVLTEAARRSHDES
jgi:hypothetical protein